MGCQGKVYVGDNLTFSICTHDADTGELTDATSVSYEVYEDDTASTILNGTMTKFNSKTGCYLTKIACTTANGFEAGKSYTIYISATVDTITGGISYGFMAEDQARLLKLDWSTITGEAARSMLNALRFLRNKWSLVGTTLTVTKEDDATSAWTGEVTTNASAEPITGNDPA